MLHPRVLVAEDDAELRELLVKGLRRHDLDATGVGTGAGLLAGAEDWQPDALVVDIGLPDADGRDVCQALRARGANLPVLFLTARDTRADRLSGFASGGDDYVTKPFDFAEVVARLRALLRRAGATPAVEVGGLLAVVVVAVTVALAAATAGFNLLLAERLDHDANDLLRSRAQTALGGLRVSDGRLVLPAAPDEDDDEEI